jgi:hypothetical protein
MKFAIHYATGAVRPNNFPERCRKPCIYPVTML